MSNMKTVSLIDHQMRQAHHDEEMARSALASDLFGAITALTEPMLERIATLEREVDDLKAAARAQMSPAMSNLDDDWFRQKHDEVARRVGAIYDSDPIETALREAYEKGRHNETERDQATEGTPSGDAKQERKADPKEGEREGRSRLWPTEQMTGHGET